MIRADIWTEAELNVLRQMRAQGVTHSRIAEVAAPLLPPRTPPRTPAAIEGRYQKLFGAHGSRPRKRQSKTIRVHRSTNADRWRAALEARDVEHYERPKTRQDCLPGGCNGARPCPWVGCKHHLYLDVNEETGSIRINHPAEPWELADTCALDLADRAPDRGDGQLWAGEHTLDTIAAALGCTRERARQILREGLAALRTVLSAAELEALSDLRSADREEEVREPVAPQLPIARRYLPVVRTPERPQLDAEARAIAASQAVRLNPRTWLRRAAARRER